MASQLKREKLILTAWPEIFIVPYWNINGSLEVGLTY